MGNKVLLLADSFHGNIHRILEILRQ